jgi:hypothetical protein
VAYKFQHSEHGMKELLFLGFLENFLLKFPIPHEIRKKQFPDKFRIKYMTFHSQNILLGKIIIRFQIKI